MSNGILVFIEHKNGVINKSSLEAIAARDKTIGAFVCRADKVGAASAGPLRGIAVGIKDIMDTQDFPTEMGSPIYKGFRSRGDAVSQSSRSQATRARTVRDKSNTAQ